MIPLLGIASDRIGWAFLKSRHRERGFPSLSDSPLPRPPSRGRITGRNLGRPQRHQMAALVRIAPDFGALAAAHVALQLMDRRRLRSPHDVERDGLVRVAAKAFHFEITEP